MGSPLQPPGMSGTPYPPPACVALIYQLSSARFILIPLTRRTSAPSPATTLPATTTFMTVINDAQRSGEVTLLSSDGARLRVPAKHLLKASAYLRSQLPSLTSVSDKVIRAPASAVTVRYFADVIQLPFTRRVDWATLPFTLPDDWATSDRLLQLVHLLIEWQCGPLLAAVMRSVQQRSGESLFSFVLGAAANCLEVVYAAIENNDDVTWGVDTATPPEFRCEPQMSILDPAAWPAYMYTMCPGPYAWALARMWRALNNTQTTGSEVTFEEILRIACTSPVQSTERRGQATGKIVDDDRFTHGDLELISADGVRFRVPSYHLLAISSFFRDLFSLPLSSGSPSITFDDAEFETAAVLRLFLSFVVYGTLDASASPSSPTSPTANLSWAPAMPYTLDGVRELVLFLRKWQAESTLSHILLLVERAVATKKACVLRAFIVAAVVDDVPFMTSLLGRNNTFFTTHENDIPDLAERGCVGASVWEPGAWPISMWTKCPPRYARAVAHAYYRQERGSWLPEAFEEQLAS